MTAAIDPPGIKLWNLTRAHIRRDFGSAWSYRLPFIIGLFSSIVSLVLFFFIAKLVDQADFSGTPELANGYFGFVTLGSALVSVMTVGLTANSSRLQRAQSTGTLEIMAAAPTPLWLSTFLGSIYDLLYASLSAIVTVALAIIFFGVRLDAEPRALPLVFFGTIATFLLFASIGMCIAAFGLVFKRTGPLLALIESGLAFLGGVFFPIDLLPGPIAFVARLMPFTWAVDLIRLSLLAGEVPIVPFVALCASALLMFPLAIVLFGYALRHTQQSGTLSHY